MLEENLRKYLQESMSKQFMQTTSVERLLLLQDISGLDWREYQKLCVDVLYTNLLQVETLTLTQHETSPFAEDVKIFKVTFTLPSPEALDTPPNAHTHQLDDVIKNFFDFETNDTSVKRYFNEAFWRNVLLDSNDLYQLITIAKANENETVVYIAMNQGDCWKHLPIDRVSRNRLTVSWVGVDGKSSAETSAPPQLVVTVPGLTTSRYKPVFSNLYTSGLVGYAVGFWVLELLYPIWCSKPPKELFVRFWRNDAFLFFINEDGANTYPLVSVVEKHQLDSSTFKTEVLVEPNEVLNDDDWYFGNTLYHGDWCNVVYSATEDLKLMAHIEIDRLGANNPKEALIKALQTHVGLTGQCIQMIFDSK